MWKAIIVEDEVVVREAIIQTMDWQAAGFQLIGEASNGLEALDLIHQHKPDLVISDIMMPMMDGISLLKQSRDEGYQSLFVMLTCLNEFEYARQALEYGASSYILKLSINSYNLQQMLHKMNKELWQRNNRLLYPFLEGLYRRIWDDFHVEMGQAAASRGSFTVNSAPMQLPNFFICCALHGESLFDKDIFLSWGLLANGDDPDAVIQVFKHDGATTLFYWSSQIQLLNSSEVQLPYPAVLSEVCIPDHFTEKWLDVIEQVSACWYDGVMGLQRLFKYERELVQAPITQQDSLRALEFKLYRSMEAMHNSESYKLIGQIAAVMRELLYPFYRVQDFAKRLVKSNTSRDQAVGEITKMMNCMNHTQLFKELEQFMNQWFADQSMQLDTKTDHKEINIIIRHIEKNYEKQISLQSMSNMISMDKNYVSGLFKKKTGDTLIDFLHKIRVEKSKDYLLDSDLSIHEIGNLVGFSNENYFFKIFKRKTGVTPNEFRKDR